MRLVPKTNNGRISFFSSRLGKWEQNAEAIGVSEEEVETLAGKVEVARQAYKEQQFAMNMARSATLRLNSAIGDMMNAGSTLILRVRAKALQDGNGVYPLASIPRPKKASEVQAPGKPTDFVAELGTIGEMSLKWKCKQPRGAVGTMYRISRRLDLGESQYLATVGKKKFTDETVPQGTKNIIYEIQAIRSNKAGPLATFNVSLGMNEGVGASRAKYRAAA